METHRRRAVIAAGLCPLIAVLGQTYGQSNPVSSFAFGMALGLLLAFAVVSLIKSKRSGKTT